MGECWKHEGCVVRWQNKKAMCPLCALMMVAINYRKGHSGQRVVFQEASKAKEYAELEAQFSAVLDRMVDNYHEHAKAPGK